MSIESESAAKEPIPVLSVPTTVTDTEGKEHTIVPEGHIAIDQRQLETLLSNLSEQSTLYDEICSDMRKTVDALLDIMNLMGKKGNKKGKAGILTFATRVLAKPQIMQEYMQPLEEILDKYTEQKNVD